MTSVGRFYSREFQLNLFVEHTTDYLLKGMECYGTQRAVMPLNGSDVS